MKISAIKSYGTYNTPFGNKKNKEVYKSVHSSFPLKAVPLAVLLAMNPINAQIATSQNISTQTEYNLSQSKLISQDYYKSQNPKEFSCRIDVYKTIDGDKYVELYLTKKMTYYAIDENRNVVNEYRLKEITLRPEELSSKTETKTFVNGNKSVESTHYVIGSGTERTGSPQSPDTHSILENTRPFVYDVKNQKYEIPAEAYKHLKRLLNDKIKINEETSSVYVIQGRK